ncbi:hypothetical protein [Streptomyces mirabilis]|uniref:hypothetical protein n=1 Tax=Streptomyces mirabilis TaxID=68239 RepID=UPI0033202D01
MCLDEAGSEGGPVDVHEQAQRWFFGTPGVPVPADRVKELTDAAVRRPAGEARATLARD